jgi:hypothetical protein
LTFPLSYIGATFPGLALASSGSPNIITAWTIYYSTCVFADTLNNQNSVCNINNFYLGDLSWLSVMIYYHRPSTTAYSDGEVDELYKKVAFLDGVKKAGGVEVEKGGIKIQTPPFNSRTQQQ